MLQRTWMMLWQTAEPWVGVRSLTDQSPHHSCTLALYGVLIIARLRSELGVFYFLLIPGPYVVSCFTYCREWSFSYYASLKRKKREVRQKVLSQRVKYVLVWWFTAQGNTHAAAMYSHFMCHMWEARFPAWSPFGCRRSSLVQQGALDRNATHGKPAAGRSFFQKKGLPCFYHHNKDITYAVPQTHTTTGA